VGWTGPAATIQGNCFDDFNFNPLDPPRYMVKTEAYTNAAATILDATSNWWGSTDVATIQQRIFDHQDNIGAPVVDFDPFKNAPDCGSRACGYAIAQVNFMPGSGTNATSAVQALGAPDGQAVPLGLNGVLELRLDQPVLNGAGKDLAVYENGSGDGAIDENFRVEVSTNGTTWVLLGECAGGDCSFDIAFTGLASVSYVRLTDLPPQEAGTTAPDLGADIDAVATLRCSESCNDWDDDGDYAIDEGCDDDGDGWCDKNMVYTSAPGTCPGGGQDCDDSKAYVHPGQPEICGNLFDDDCNGLADAKDAGLDHDGDGFGAGACGADCDDTRASVHPGAFEIEGNGLDDNCDGFQDDARSTVTGKVLLGDRRDRVVSASVKLCRASGSPCRAPVSTDATGTYRITSVGSGDWIVQVSLTWIDPGPPDPDGAGPLPTPPNPNGTLTRTVTRSSGMVNVGAIGTVSLEPIIFPQPVVLVHGFRSGACVLEKASCRTNLGISSQKANDCDRSSNTWKPLYDDLIANHGVVAFTAVGLSPCQLDNCGTFEDCKLHDWNADRLFEYLTHADGIVRGLLAPGTDTVAFDVVGHSMGGITTRVMLSKHEASRKFVRKAVVAGTPNAGTETASWGSSAALLMPSFKGAHYLTIGYMDKVNRNHGVCGANGDVPVYYVTGAAAMPVLREPAPNDTVVAKQSTLDCRVTEFPLENAAFRAVAREVQIQGVDYSETANDHYTLVTSQSGRGAIWSALTAPMPRDADRPRCPYVAHDCVPSGAAEPSGPLSSSADLLATVTRDSVPAGETTWHAHVLDGSARSLFELQYDGGSVTFTLEDPNGRVIDPAAAAIDPNVTYEESTGFASFPSKLYTVTNPVPGLWWLRIDAAQDAGPAGVDLVTSSTSQADATLAVAVDPIEVATGQSPTIRATITSGGLPVAGATVEARVEDRLGRSRMLVLRDNGIAPDASAGDGVYAARYGPLSTTGLHRFEVVVQGYRSDGQDFQRTAYTTLEVSTTSASFTDLYDDRAVDDGGSTGYERLEVDVEIDVAAVGDFVLTGKLSATPPAGTAREIASATLEVSDLAVGLHTLVLRFPGSHIRSSGIDGPYKVVSLTLARTDATYAITDTRSVTPPTHPYAAGSFAAGDIDADGVSDLVDNCPRVSNVTQTDSDGDGPGDACDTCPAISDPAQADADSDGFGDACDRCPAVASASNTDLDGDGLGDACDPDSDGDGVANGQDCGPLDASAWSRPPEIGGLVILPDKVTIQWVAATSPDGLAIAYDAVLGPLATLRSGGGFDNSVCLLVRGALPKVTDTNAPEVGVVHYYLARAATRCRAGSWGNGKTGERSMATCP